MFAESVPQLGGAGLFERRAAIPAVLLLIFLVTAVVHATPVYPTNTLDDLFKMAKHVVVADVATPAKTVGGGLKQAVVEPKQTLFGPKVEGKTLVTVRGDVPLEVGRRYLLAGLEGTVGESKYIALQELGVVEVPPTFDLQSLAGKEPREQVRAVMQARQGWIRTELERLKREQEHIQRVTQAAEPPAPGQGAPPGPAR
jgi:hypothetical protein